MSLAPGSTAAIPMTAIMWEVELGLSIGYCGVVEQGVIKLGLRDVAERPVMVALQPMFSVRWVTAMNSDHACCGVSDVSSET